MKRSTLKRPRQRAPEFSIERASILELPMLFQIIQDGAEAGSFSGAFVERTGSFKLLRTILHGVVFQYFQFFNARSRYEWSVVRLQNGETAGFLKTSRNVGARIDVNLELLAICSSYRNLGIGSAVLERVLNELPSGARLLVHCTKYSRAMQHILKRHHFRRNVKFGVPQLEEYQSNWIPRSSN